MISAALLRHVQGELVSIRPSCWSVLPVSPKSGSSGQPLSRTPLGVLWIRKCRTSSLARSPPAGVRVRVRDVYDPGVLLEMEEQPTLGAELEGGRGRGRGHLHRQPVRPPEGAAVPDHEGPRIFVLQNCDGCSHTRLESPRSAQEGSGGGGSGGSQYLGLWKCPACTRTSRCPAQTSLLPFCCQNLVERPNVSERYGTIM